MASKILEEQYDADYEPSDQEIKEYAQFLGMDIEKEQELFWIARDSLKAPLPKDWKPCQTDDGNVYYFNFKTGESIWEHPCDEKYRQIYKDEKAKWLAKKASQATVPKETRAAAYNDFDDDSDESRPKSGHEMSDGSEIKPIQTKLVSGLKPLAESGLKPLDSGLKPLESSHKPLDSGLKPVSAAGLKPVEANLKPLSSTGLKPVTTLKPLSDTGLKAMSLSNSFDDLDKPSGDKSPKIESLSATVEPPLVSNSAFVERPREERSAYVEPPKEKRSANVEPPLVSNSAFVEPPIAYVQQKSTTSLETVERLKKQEFEEQVAQMNTKYTEQLNRLQQDKEAEFTLKKSEIDSKFKQALRDVQETIERGARREIELLSKELQVEYNAMGEPQFSLPKNELFQGHSGQLFLDLRNQFQSNLNDLYSQMLRIYKQKEQEVIEKLSEHQKRELFQFESQQKARLEQETESKIQRMKKMQMEYDAEEMKIKREGENKILRARDQIEDEIQKIDTLLTKRQAEIHEQHLRLQDREQELKEDLQKREREYEQRMDQLEAAQESLREQLSKQQQLLDSRKIEIAELEGKLQVQRTMVEARAQTPSERPERQERERTEKYDRERPEKHDRERPVVDRDESESDYRQKAWMEDSDVSENDYTVSRPLQTLKIKIKEEEEYLRNAKKYSYNPKESYQSAMERLDKGASSLDRVESELDRLLQTLRERKPLQEHSQTTTYVRKDQKPYEGDHFRTEASLKEHKRWLQQFSARHAILQRLN